MSEENMFQMDDSGTGANPAPKSTNRDAGDTGESQVQKEAGGAGTEPHAESFKKAMLEERSKRKELQAKMDEQSHQIAELRGAVHGIGGGRQSQQDDKAEEEWTAKFFDRPKRAIGESLDDYQQRDFQKRLQQTVVWARQDHDDYEGLVQRYAARAEADQRASFAIRHAMNPAEEFLRHARRWAKAEVSQTTTGALAGKSLEEIEAHFRAKFDAESKNDAAVSAAEANPQTLAGARGSGTGASRHDTSEDNLGFEPFGLDRELGGAH